MRWTCVLGMVCLLGSWQLPAAEESEPRTAPLGPTAEELSDGFVSIFDGQTLDGWRGSTEGYTCENGVLVCQKRGGGRLMTVQQFGDFVFRFDYRLEPGGNNGISVRGQEIQVLDNDAPQYQNLKACQYHGSIYCRVPALRGHTKPAGEWNSEEIECRGSHWKVSVNGTVIVDVDLATVPDCEALAKRTSGPLGFLGHGERVEFRNLRVKPLTSVEP